jgi:putative ABC transport system permease protein
MSSVPAGDLRDGDRVAGPLQLGAAGASGGWVLSQMLVKVLTGVFDPPPEHLAVPWAYLGIVAGVAVLGLVLAALAAIQAARRPPLTVLRDL